jgi:hypothetical protein
VGGGWGTHALHSGKTTTTFLSDRAGTERAKENQREIQGRMSLVRTIFDMFMQTYIKTLRDTLAQAQ